MYGSQFAFHDASPEGEDSKMSSFGKARRNWKECCKVPLEIPRQLLFEWSGFYFRNFVGIVAKQGFFSTQCNN